MADQILVTYKMDTQQPEKALADVQKELIITEDIGEKAFENIGKAATASATNVAKAADNTQRMAGATRNLQNSVNQLSRELPAFTMNLNTGFLAISNNLPALFDGLKNIREQNKLLAAEGKQTTSVIKALSSAIFSWQTLISVGITLLTVYGGRLFEVFDTSKKLEAEQKRLAKSTDMLNKAFDLEERRLRALGVAELDLINRRKERVRQNIQLADQELKTQELLLKKTLTSYTEANMPGVPGGGFSIIRRLFAPSEEDIMAISDKLKEIQLKRTELQVQLLELDKKAANEQKRIEDEKWQFITSKNIEWIGTIERIRNEAFQKEMYDQIEQQKKMKELEDAFFADMLKSEFDKEYALMEQQILIDKDWEKYDKEISDQEKKRQEERIMTAQQTLDTIKYSADQVFSIISGINRNTTIEAENQLKKMRKIDAQRRKDIEADFEMGLISKEERDKKLDQLEQAAIERERNLQRETAQRERSIAIFLATIKSILIGIEAALNPTKIPQAIFAAAELGVLISTPLPEFKEGVIDFKGKGTETSDSNVVKISAGESVIKAKSTRFFKDELKAINTNPLDYQKLIEQKYVMPAIEKERQNQASFAENIARSIALHNAFNDERIVKTLEKNKPATSKDIAILAATIEKNTRLEKFKSKLIRQR